MSNSDTHLPSTKNKLLSKPPCSKFQRHVMSNKKGYGFTYFSSQPNKQEVVTHVQCFNGKQGSPTTSRIYPASLWSAFINEPNCSSYSKFLFE